MTTWLPFESVAGSIKVVPAVSTGEVNGKSPVGGVF